VLKVVFTMTFAERGGGSQQVLWTFLRHLDRARFDPTVVFLAPGAFPAEVAALGISTVVVPAGRFRQPWQGARAVAELARVMRGAQPDLVVSWFTRAHLYAVPAAVVARLSHRLVWWQHGVTRGDALDRAATALPALAVGTSSQGAARAQARLRPRREVFTVYPGIDEPVPESAPDRARRMERLGLEAGVPVVGTVGRIDPVKEQHRLLDAVATLRARGLPVNGLVVGGPEPARGLRYLDALRRRARETGIEDAVTFTGPVPDVAPYVGLMDVAVNTCPREAFGLALLEAMALSVPVVAVDAPGPREIIEHERSGLLVDPRDGSGLADALAGLLKEADLRHRLREGARERFEACFTAERMTRDLSARLADLAGR